MPTPLTIWRSTLNAGAAVIVISSVQPASQVLHQVGLMSDPSAFNQAVDSVPLVRVMRSASNGVMAEVFDALGAPQQSGVIGQDLQSTGTIEFSQ